MSELGEWGRWWRGWRGRKGSCAGRRQEQKRQTWTTWYHFLLSSSLLPLSSPLPSSHSHLFDVTDVMVSRRTDRERIPVRYCTLGTRDAARYHLTWLLSQLCAWSESEYDERCACVLRDPHTLVELSAFSAINRFQPFNVAVSSNVLLLMVSIKMLSSRPASHWSQVKVNLPTSPTVGLPLSPDHQWGGGIPRRTMGYQHAVWVRLYSTKESIVIKSAERRAKAVPLSLCISVLTVLRAFPCRTRLADRDLASAVEEEVTHAETQRWKNPLQTLKAAVCSLEARISTPTKKIALESSPAS